MRRNQPWFTAMISVGTAVLGAILGVAIGSFKSDFGVAVAICTILAISAIVLLTSLNVLIQNSGVALKEGVEAHKETLGKGEAIGARVEASIRESNAALKKSMTDLANQFGLRVDRMLLEDIQRMEGGDGDITAGIVLNAKKEILILDQLSDDGVWPDWAIDEGPSSAFLNGVLAHVERQSPSVIYKRIVQVVDPSDILAIGGPKLYANHCSQMLEMRRAIGHRVSLRATRRHFPFKFILVDRCNLILQLQAFDRDGRDISIWGEIIVRDPQLAFAAVFSDIWDEIDDDPTTRTVQVVDSLSTPTP